MISRKNNMKAFAVPLFILIPAMLVGCGGDSSDGDNNTVDKPLAPAPVLNSFIEKLKTGDERNIDFSDAVYRPDLSQTYSLDNVTVESGNCTVVPVSDFTYAVNATDDGLCNLKYTVSNSDNVSASSDATVIASSSILTTYPMIGGINASVGTPIEIDILDELAKKGIDTTGLIIDPNIYTTGVGLSSVDATKQIIQFDGTDFGVASIIYALKDSTGSVDGYGRIDIAVSSAFNTAPEAYTSTYSEVIKPSTSYTVDINSLVDDMGMGIIYDPDGDKLQLVAVSAYDIPTLRLTNPSDITNTSFTFTASFSELASFDIMYTVSDHKGGYASNVIHFKQDSPSYGYPWKDFYTKGSLALKRFIAPTTEERIDSYFKPFIKLVDEIYSIGGDNKVFHVTAMDKDTAAKYCQSLNAHLWRDDEIVNLLGGGGLSGSAPYFSDIQTKYMWPASIGYESYWVQDGAFNIKDGKTDDSVDPLTKLYPACALGGIKKIDVTNTAKCASRETNKLSVYLQDIYGMPISGAQLNFSSDPSVKFQTSAGAFPSVDLYTDSNGYVSVDFFTSGTGANGCNPDVIIKSPGINGATEGEDITIQSEFQP